MIRLLNFSKWVYIGVAASTAALLIFYRPSPPYVPFGVDRVEPAIVRAGDTVNVYRTFRAVRPDQVSVSRAMQRADCKQSGECEVVDLSYGTLTLDSKSSYNSDVPGEYVDIKRAHVIPKRVSAGRWNLVFSVKWTNFLGGTQTLILPPLFVEIIE